MTVLETIQTEGFWTVANIAEATGLSTATVRRQAKKLAHDDVIQAIKWGAGYTFNAWEHRADYHQHCPPTNRLVWRDPVDLGEIDPVTGNVARYGRAGHWDRVRTTDDLPLSVTPHAAYRRIS